MELCLADGHPEPEYIEDEGGVMVTMYSKRPMMTAVHMPPLTEDIMNPREKRIITLLYANPLGLSTTEIMEKLKESVIRKTIRRSLISLEEKNIVVRQGQGNKVRWMLRFFKR